MRDSGWRRGSRAPHACDPWTLWSPKSKLCFAWRMASANRTSRKLTDMKHFNGYTAYSIQDMAIWWQTTAMLFPATAFCYEIIIVYINPSIVWSIFSNNYVYKGDDCANMEMVVDGSDSSVVIKTYLKHLKQCVVWVQTARAVTHHNIIPGSTAAKGRGKKKQQQLRESPPETHRFKLNCEDPDTPKFHGTMSSTTTQRRRQRDNEMETGNSVSPTNPEKFYLLILLFLHVPPYQCLFTITIVSLLFF